jgi:hypothetical protein
MAYEYVAYPKWLYHETQPPVLVQDPEEHAALGEGWEETPAAFAGKPAEEPAQEQTEPGSNEPAAEPKKRGKKAAK